MPTLYNNLVNNVNHKVSTDVSLVTKTTTGKVIFWKAEDEPIVGLSEERDIYLDTIGNSVLIIVDRLFFYSLSFYGLTDLVGRPYAALQPQQGNDAAYAAKLKQVYEDLQSVFVGCCECGGGVSNVEFADTFEALPVTGEVDVLYVVKTPPSLFIWNGTDYDSVGGGGDFVPYTGATSDVDLGANGLITDFVKYNTTPASTLEVGQMQWNDQDGTLDLRLKGNNVTLQLGQEQVQRVVNKTGSNLTEAGYAVVRSRLVSEGGAEGQRLAVLLAQANTVDNVSTTLGLVTENIANNQEGFVTTNGVVRGINTTGSLQGETWADGDVLYLSPTVAGGLTNVQPSLPNYLVVIGVVVYAHGVNGKIFVNIQNDYRLNELPYIPLSGTEAGFPVTGPVELADGVNIFGDATDDAGFNPLIRFRGLDSTKPLFEALINETSYRFYENLEENPDTVVVVGTLKKRFWTKAGIWDVNDDLNAGYIVGSLLWDTTNKVMYVCEDNTAGAAVWEVYYDPKTTIQSITISGASVTTTANTAQNITGLVTPTLPANSVWFFEIDMLISCTGAGGVRLGFTAPSGATGQLSIIGTATALTTYLQTSTTGALATTAVNRFNGASYVRMTGRVKIGATAGAVQLQFASGTSGQTSTIFGDFESVMNLKRLV